MARCRPLQAGRPWAPPSAIPIPIHTSRPTHHVTADLSKAVGRTSMSPMAVSRTTWEPCRYPAPASETCLKDAQLGQAGASWAAGKAHQPQAETHMLTCPEGKQARVHACRRSVHSARTCVGHPRHRVLPIDHGPTVGHERAILACKGPIAHLTHHTQNTFQQRQQQQQQQQG